MHPDGIQAAANQTTNEMYEVFNDGFMYFCLVMLMIYGIRAVYAFYGLPEILPESAFFIALGVLVSWTMRSIGPEYFQLMLKLKLTHFSFFTILLPPIILDASYNLYHPVFISNIPTILVFAIFGTLINFLFLGTMITLLHDSGLVPPMPGFSAKDGFLYSAIAVAVDPVAVIQTFEELSADVHLQFLVSGEAMLNDGMTVNLYKTMIRFQHVSAVETNYARELFRAGCNTVLSTLVSAVMGIAISLFCAVITKRTGLTSVSQPTILLCCGMLTYLLAEFTNQSGIIALICCGVLLAAYANCNMSDNSKRSFKEVLHFGAAMCETLIFLSIGVEVVATSVITTPQRLNLHFMCAVCILCFIGRMFTTVTLSQILNKFRCKPLLAKEQVISFYAGLRGAVALSLVMTVDHEYTVGSRQEMLYNFRVTMLVLVLLMNVVMGPLTKFLVKSLDVKIESNKYNKPPILTAMTQEFLGNLMASIEFIAGTCWWRLVWREFDKVALAPSILAHPQMRNEVLNAFLRDEPSQDTRMLYPPIVIQGEKKK